MQELCLKNCDQDAAGKKLENLSKGGMVWEQTVYRKGFLPCCMLAASAVKAPRLAIPLASSNELTNDPSLGKGQVEQEGRMRSSRRVCRSKRRLIPRLCR